MDYIVFDLEWNQCPYGKDKEVHELPFEIIEIGAVKLNSKLKIIDKFQCFIKPVVYNQFHRITGELLNITMKDLSKGLPFEKAIDSFIRWCGSDYRFCTWGNTDLYELQRNMKYFGIENNLELPLFYYDIQKLFSIEFEDGKIRRSLEYAASERNLDLSQVFHSALADAEYTAEIMTHMDFFDVCDYFSIDTYRIPETKKDEIEVIFKKYSKYVSMGHEKKETLMADKKLFHTRCYICGRLLRKKIRWFSYNTKVYYCLCNCEEHGYVKGRLKVKRNEDGLFYAVKIMKITDEEGAAKIKAKQEDVRRKRKEKRKRERRLDRQLI